MTKLEALFKKIDEEYEDKGSVDPIEYVKAFLEDRDALVSALLPEAISTNIKAHLKNFDNQEVEL